MFLLRKPSVLFAFSFILAVRLDDLHLLDYNVISDSNGDITTILSDPVSAKWCITLVWAENFVIKVFGF